MDRNTEQAYGVLDTIDAPRSTWHRNFNHKTSFNAGLLVPFYFNMDILPGTTIKNKTTIVCRMSTPINPIMDNLYLDTYYFKCSKFWYWEHFRAMIGENEMGEWEQETEYTEPKIITQSSTPTTVNDLLTYIGVPLAIPNLQVSKMAVNAYIDIWNNWFRDQNLQAPIRFDKTDANVKYDGTIKTGGTLLPVAKFHDYFTSALPQPQKGTAITTPLGTTAPIMTGTEATIFNSTVTGGSRVVGTSPVVTAANQSILGGVPYDPAKNVKAGSLYADLTQATAATINALRLAFATQHILEKDARFGTRYREILKGHWGVTAGDEALLVPEYLGGVRTPINIETVLQNSQTSEQSPLGNTGAFSVTASVNEDFTKSFTKDDMLIGVMCVRAEHTYQQGLPRQFTRTRRLDRYWPALSHIGNQPIYNYEIYAQGNAQDNEVFGYKEAFQEYLYHNNRISGELLSTFAQSLDSWHFGDDYSSLPVLSDEWIREPKVFIDRTLAVQSSIHHQFIADIEVEQIVSAPIPLNRTPGLIDHF